MIPLVSAPDGKFETATTRPLQRSFVSRAPLRMMIALSYLIAKAKGQAGWLASLNSADWSTRTVLVTEIATELDAVSLRPSRHDVQITTRRFESRP